MQFPDPHRSQTPGKLLCRTGRRTIFSQEISRYLFSYRYQTFRRGGNTGNPHLKRYELVCADHGSEQSFYHWQKLYRVISLGQPNRKNRCLWRLNREDRCDADTVPPLSCRASLMKVTEELGRPDKRWSRVRRTACLKSPFDPRAMGRRSYIVSLRSCKEVFYWRSLFGRGETA